MYSNKSLTIYFSKYDFN